jgi:hypothetical protein
MKFLPWLNFIVLTLTLAFLIWYTYDTHRIANQTVEANLQPVVLRSGFIPNWDAIHFEMQSSTIAGQPIQFTIFKNIAKDFSGFVILNGRKYQLLFGNQISQVQNSSSASSSSGTTLTYTPTWGWMSPNSILLAIFNPNDFQAIKGDNEIYIEYKDIEGNSYFTREDKNFSSTSGKL